MANVENLLPSKDKVVCSAEVRVLRNDNKRTVILRRPIQHLIPLEVQDSSAVQDPNDVQDSSEVQDSSDVQDSSEVEDSSKQTKGQADPQPRRIAAVNGELI